MTKLLNCPICHKQDVPVRNDAKVCSSVCRVKQWRKAQKDKALIARLKNNEHIKD